MTEADLKEIGVASFGIRRKLHMALKLINESSADCSISTCSTEDTWSTSSETDSLETSTPIKPSCTPVKPIVIKPCDKGQLFTTPKVPYSKEL